MNMFKGHSAILFFSGFALLSASCGSSEGKERSAQLLASNPAVEAIHTDCTTDPCPQGLTCVSYFGVLGDSGPEFHTCEIPCLDAQGLPQCPEDLQCVTIADGPGSVCDSVVVPSPGSDPGAPTPVDQAPTPGDDGAPAPVDQAPTPGDDGAPAPVDADPNPGIAGPHVDCSSDACEDGLTCVAYTGVTGLTLHTCEWVCTTDADCPANLACVWVADGPGLVCM